MHLAAWMQELKTAQPELPDKVADALAAADWLQYHGTPCDKLFLVPGLTLTSFHLQQLQRLRSVGRYALPCSGRHAATLAPSCLRLI